jgi:hypothetical protein
MQRYWRIGLCCFVLSFIFALPVTAAPAANNSISKLLRNEAVESQISVNLMKADPRFNQQHIDIHCFNGVVLLTGEVANASLKSRAGQVAFQTERVRQVHNQLQITGTASYLSRINDSWLATKVRTQLMRKKIKDSQVLVTSNQGHIYLMGTLTPTQAREAMKIAQSVEGVQGVTDLVKSNLYVEQFR